MKLSLFNQADNKILNKIISLEGKTNLLRYDYYLRVVIMN